MNREAEFIEQIKNLCEKALSQLNSVEYSPDDRVLNLSENYPEEITAADLRNIRFGDFSLGKISFLGSDKDVFPYRIHVDKWESCEPHEVYSLSQEKYIMMDKYCYAVGELEWDAHEGDWDFNSVGVRFLEIATEDVCKWLLDFCKNYYVEDGRLLHVEEDY